MLPDDHVLKELVVRLLEQARQHRAFDCVDEADGVETAISLVEEFAAAHRLVDLTIKCSKCGAISWREWYEDGTHLPDGWGEDIIRDVPFDDAPMYHEEGVEYHWEMRCPNCPVSPE